MPVRLALAVMGAVLAGYSVWLAERAVGFAFAAESVRALTLFTATGVCLFAAALWGWRRGVLSSSLVALAAAAWFVTSWPFPTTHSAVAFTAGLCFVNLGPAVIGHLTLTAHGQQPWLLPRAGYVAAVGIVGLSSTAFFDPGSEGCGDCPANLVLLDADPSTAQTFARAGFVLMLAWIGATCLVVARHHLRSSRLRRRQVALPVLGGMIFLLAWAGALALNLNTGHLGYTATERALWTVQAVGLLLLAVGVVGEDLRARRTHSEVARLVLDLESGFHAGGMRADLARRLGDPGLRLGYPTDDGHHVDGTGAALDVPAEPGRATPLERFGREVALVIHRPGLLDDPVLKRELSEAGHLALESEGLRARSMALLAEMRASRVRLLEAGDQQRRRLERDLHDGAQQRLVGLSFWLGRLEHRGGPDAARIEQAVAAVQQALDDLRTLGRGLFPVTLREQGLAAALTSLTESAPLRVLAVPEGRMSGLAETTAYLLIDRATIDSSVDASLSSEDGRLAIVLDIHGPAPDLGDAADRIQALDGALTISRGTNGTTRLVARIDAAPAQ